MQVSSMPDDFLNHPLSNTDKAMDVLSKLLVV